MIAITTSNSIKVKPNCRILRREVLFATMHNTTLWVLKAVFMIDEFIIPVISHAVYRPKR